MDGPARAKEDIGIAIDKGRIVAVAPLPEIAARFEPANTVKRPDHVAMPGFVNAHCHAAMSLFRGFSDDQPLETWLNETIWPLEGRLVDRAFVADGTRLAIAEMLQAGITCFGDMYYFPDVVAAVASEAGMRASVGMIALEFPTVWAQTVDEYIDRGLEVHDRYRSDPLISTTFAPHAPYTVGDDTLSRIRGLADELDVPIHTHLHETAEEIHQSLAEHGMRPLARLESLGLVTPLLTAVHATQLEPPEISALAERGVSIVHCPRANLKLASGACPAAALHNRGVNVALGTDGAAGNNRLDIMAEMQTAALLAKHVAGDAAAMPAAEALALATINGARALGLADEIGSLSPGKAADIICVDLSAAHHLPVYDPLSSLVYAAGREDVSDVWVAGEALVRDHALIRLPTDSIRESAEHWAKRVKEPE